MTVFQTHKTPETANSWEVRIADYSPIQGPYVVIARNLSRSEAMFLAETLNSRGWDHATAYNAVDALVQADTLHEELHQAMQRAGRLHAVPVAA